MTIVTSWSQPVALMLCMIAAATTPAWSDQTLPGFRARLSGEVLKYHAPDPDVTTGLLVRSLDAARGIEWETAAVPTDFDGEFAHFVWMFALQVHPEKHRFTLAVNGETWFEFRNPPTHETRDWTIDGPNGASLRFRATMIDRFNDLMGFAILTVPRNALTPGQPLRLRVNGESAASRAWYITFQAPVSERAELIARPALLRDTEGNYQPLILFVTHLGAPIEVVITTSFGAELRRTLALGGNRFELRHPEVSEPRNVTVNVRVGDRDLHVLRAEVAPVRQWTIHLVQHAHTDVGYTRTQMEILPEHMRFIDTALDLCDQTDAYPPDAQFRWTCEVSWPVREYLRSRTPEQIERLRRRVQEGRIEVTDMLLNMSEVMDEAGYAAFVQPIRDFRENGLNVTTAMQDDVNGVAWCLADYFPQMGIEYLVMGEHGHRALIPFDQPTAFWWETPAGSRVLAFRADHYMTGNYWGVHTGKVEAVEDELLHYLTNLEKGGYPYNRIAVQHSGYPTDNSPPSVASCELVKQWNQRFIWPQLRSAVAREFPEYVKKHHAASLPVHRLAWPDWWTDGFASAARESAVARLTHSQLTAIESLFAIQACAGLALPSQTRAQIDGIRDGLAFWGEHTLGSAESIREPLCENSQVQWAAKAAYAWDAAKRTATLGEHAMGRMRALNANADSPRLLVVNTLNFPRSGLAEIYADHEILPIDRRFRVLDDQGRELPVQRLRSRDDGSYWAIWVSDIPAFGWREFNIDVSASEPIAVNPPLRETAEIENAHFRVALDSERGGVRELIDKASGVSLIDVGSNWLLGQIVHEALGNREQLEGFMLDDYSRRSLDHVVLEGAADGPIWTSLQFRGEMPGCEGPGGVRCEIRLFHPEKRLDLVYTIQKRRVYDPEAIYVAFPFAMPNGRVIYETLGGIVAPATDIIPGTSSDWQAAQAFAAAQSPASQIVLSSPEIPLFQFGGINTGKFQRNIRIDKPHIFSWVMNNYWTTNFCASQEGEFRWSYAITSSTDTTTAFATRFGWSRRMPLLARVNPGGGAARPLDRKSILPFDKSNLLMVAARPAANGQGVILHLREVDGKPARLTVSDWQAAGRPIHATPVNALEEPLDPAQAVIEFRPWQTHFVRVETN